MVNLYILEQNILEINMKIFWKSIMKRVNQKVIGIEEEFQVIGTENVFNKILQ